ncbi:hypothetical protein GCM10023340_23140 [Nocardioides marinquilinus]|uniref:DUF732 domain-containing protein n=1 Tax=Nocardioides marinquilinus TaxID=1210400 RepID=A0ABP9PLV9_9ACTN
MRSEPARRPLALGAVSLAVGVGLGGCSWSGLSIFDGFLDVFEPESAGDVTCGQWLDQSTEQRRSSVVDLIEDSDDEAVQDTLDEFEAGDERDDFLDSIAEFITSECESKGEDDTRIGEYVYADF